MDNSIEYKKAEKSCRARFTEWAKNQPGLWDIKFEEYDFERTDAIFTSGFTQVVCEIKTRAYTHDHSWGNQTPNWIYEGIKHKALLKHPIKDKFYAIIFNDKVVIWNTGVMIGLNWTYGPHMKSGVGSHEKEMKWATYLPIEWASHIFPI